MLGVYGAIRLRKKSTAQAETGRASNQKHVRKSADSTGVPEFFADRLSSGFDKKLDADKMLISTLLIAIFIVREYNYF